MLQGGVDVNGDGTPDLSTSRIYYFGQSFGGIYGVAAPRRRAGRPRRCRERARRPDHRDRAALAELPAARRVLAARAVAVALQRRAESVVHELQREHAAHGTSRSSSTRCRAPTAIQNVHRRHRVGAAVGEPGGVRAAHLDARSSSSSRAATRPCRTRRRRAIIRAGGLASGRPSSATTSRSRRSRHVPRTRTRS